MVIIGSALYFLILGLVLYVMDRQVYTAAKVEIIRDNFVEIFRLPDNLNEQARRVLYGASDAAREAESLKLEQALQEVVDGPTSMFSMSLIDENGRAVLDVRNPGKPASMNTWRNSLFLRNFQGRTSQHVSPYRYQMDEPTTAGVRLAYLTGVYTSPVGMEEIERLTSRYRLYAVALCVAWVLAWWGIYRYLLRPVRNVTVHLDRSRFDAPTLIPRAQAALEQGYNDLAATALYQLIEEKLGDVGLPEDGDGAPAAGQRRRVREAMALAAESFGAAQLRVRLLSATPDPETMAEQYEYVASDAADAAEWPAFDLPEGLDEPQVLGYPDGSGFVYFGALASGYLQADCRYGATAHAPHQRHDYLVRACEALRSGFVSMQAFREQLFRERSEANISLSRNMGHDLTNIIATSKLELMGIKRVLSSVQPGQALSEQRAVILGDAVRGLLESTRLMQEMVNIYRSFSYVKRPAYERRSLVDLLEEFLANFEPALSSHVRIVREFSPGCPPPIVEPRLLKLALFNVLQNALDSLKKVESMHEGEGRVRVLLRYDEATGMYEITVEDNGIGIRDEAGNLLTPAETQAIFDYGYSTKGEAGEGLGLNWVRSILVDFHDGGVRGENVQGGRGARIVLSLRSMERKEARVGAVQSVIEIKAVKGDLL